jgi:hypothetical protein
MECRSREDCELATCEFRIMSFAVILSPAVSNSWVPSGIRGFSVGSAVVVGMGGVRVGGGRGVRTENLTAGEVEIVDGCSEG